MRLLYLGLPLGALCLTASGHVPAVVGIGHRHAPGTRRLRRQLGARGVPLLGRPDLHDAGVVRALESTRPDVILSWFWPQRIPASVLALAPGGAFGVHPSLLPRWRGPDPYFWAIANGDARTGVSLHRLTAEYDRGDVIARHEVPIDGRDDAWSLARKLDRPGLALLLACARTAAAGLPQAGEAQDATQATWAPAPSPEQLAVDWHRSTVEVARLIRAAAPWPGATAQLGDTEVEVTRARALGVAPPRALRVAEAWATPEGPAVRTGDGAVVLLEGRAGDRTLNGTELWALVSGADPGQRR